jgi:hypothetical protein
MKVKRLTVRQCQYFMIDLSVFTNFHKSGSVRGMKKLFYGKDALLVQCGSYIYNVSSCPEIYGYAK